jgi:ABC-type multidrug transport system fused ATPase/permease subunit
VIPQDPTLFTGSLKFNLDPFNLVPNQRIEELLDKAGLADLLSRAENAAEEHRGINMKITEGGKNLSSGERQLICICRAILRKNKIVILDEATANIDVVTEQKIQELINEEFTDSTVITIAHRLNTIIKSDYVLVLSRG